MNEPELNFNQAVATLRRFRRPPARLERCEFCNLGLAATHQHLLEPQQRQLSCVCDACAVLFGSQGETQYLRVPRRIRSLPDFQLSSAQWESLCIPISLAFFYYSSAVSQNAQRVVVCYPSPAGPTEAALDLLAWEELAADNPVLQKLAPEVEALLVNRIGRTGDQHQYFIVPIDECFKLVGLIRRHWRGLSGGAQVWQEISEFFGALERRADVLRTDTGLADKRQAGALQEPTHA
jgi:hypothetical protein